jgi:endonuclease YncB( thermonuclease family)
MYSEAMKRPCFLLLFLLLLLPLSVLSQTLTGKVIGISDGDTITVLDADRRQHKIRLNGMDAPESAQDFGQASKRHLSDLIFDKDVSVLWRKRDKYGRSLGKVFIGNTNVNLEHWLYVVLSSVLL